MPFFFLHKIPMVFSSTAREDRNPPTAGPPVDPQLRASLDEAMYEKLRNYVKSWMSHAANASLENREAANVHEEFRMQMGFFLSLIGKILKAMAWTLVSYGFICSLNGVESASKTLTSFAKLCRALVFALWALVVLVAVGITVPFVNEIFKWAAVVMSMMGFIYVASHRSGTENLLSVGFVAAAALLVLFIKPVLTEQDPAYIGMTHHLAIYVYHASIDKQLSGELSLATAIVAGASVIVPPIISVIVAAEEAKRAANGTSPAANGTSPAGSALASTASIEILSEENKAPAPGFSAEKVPNWAANSELRGTALETNDAEQEDDVSPAGEGVSPAENDDWPGPKMFLRVLTVFLVIGACLLMLGVGNGDVNNERLVIASLPGPFYTLAFWISLVYALNDEKESKTMLPMDYVLAFFIYVGNAVLTCVAMFRERLQENDPEETRARRVSFVR